MSRTSGTGDEAGRFMYFSRVLEECCNELQLNKQGGPWSVGFVCCSCDLVGSQGLDVLRTSIVSLCELCLLIGPLKAFTKFCCVNLVTGRTRRVSLHLPSESWGALQQGRGSEVNAICERRLLRAQAFNTVKLMVRAQTEAEQHELRICRNGVPVSEGTKEQADLGGGLDSHAQLDRCSTSPQDVGGTGLPVGECTNRAFSKVGGARVGPTTRGLRLVPHLGESASITHGRLVSPSDGMLSNCNANLW